MSVLEEEVTTPHHLVCRCTTHTRAHIHTHTHTHTHRLQMSVLEEEVDELNDARDRLGAQLAKAGTAEAKVMAAEAELEAEVERFMQKVRVGPRPLHQSPHVHPCGLVHRRGAFDMRGSVRVDSVLCAETYFRAHACTFAQVKERRHALACEKATISERRRLINEKIDETDAQVRLIQETLSTLRR
jgi:hypothetical protein